MKTEILRTHNTSNRKLYFKPARHKIIEDQKKAFKDFLYRICQSNGGIERMHRALKEYLRHFIDDDQRNWDEYLTMANFAYNSSIHSATKFMPYELVLGRIG